MKKLTKQQVLDLPTGAKFGIQYERDGKLHPVTKLDSEQPETWLYWEDYTLGLDDPTCEQRVDGINDDGSYQPTYGDGESAQFVEFMQRKPLFLQHVTLTNLDQSDEKVIAKAEKISAGYFVGSSSDDSIGVGNLLVIPLQDLLEIGRNEDGPYVRYVEFDTLGLENQEYEIPLYDFTIMVP